MILIKPRSGRVVPEIANPDIRELIFNKYRIVYRFSKTTVYIVTIYATMMKH
jgi:hypothetical protein